jgi:hypothetical protein
VNPTPSTTTPLSPNLYFVVGALAIVGGITLGYIVSRPPKPAHEIAREMIASPSRTARRAA